MLSDEGAPVALLQRGLLPHLRLGRDKQAQERNKENLLPIKALPSQKRNSAQNNAVF
ncbi:hypothetical protein ACAX43_25510 [Paraburkholderia sp. IW21]|uniref:hypothetical protein n=1 Tax=Paraburkholderia sp. IW21 TaxID=3242488 RepID=UPI003520C185